MKYGDYFSRLTDIGVNNSDYVNRIREPGGRDCKRWNMLFGECFAHHVSPHIPPADHSVNINIDVRGDRWIPKDQLTSTFIHKYYKPPAVYQTSEPNIEQLIKSGEIEPIEFQKFSESISVNPITNEHESGFRAGSNRVSFLLGDIGKGKSVFATKLYNHMRSELLQKVNSTESIEDWILVPVYMDIGNEYVDSHSGEIKDIGEEIYWKLFVAIADSFLHSPLLKSRSKFSEFERSSISDRSDLIELLAHLARNKIRLIIIVDNLDQYHFQYKKWAFIDEYAITQDRSVKENIGGLVNIFETQLDNPGICALLICRDYVYQHLRMVSDTLIPKIDSATVYQLDIVETSEVVETRQDLYKEAESLIKISVGNNYEAFKALKELLLKSSDDSLQGDRSKTPVFEMLRRLSHHGHRGLVEFISEIKIHDENGDVYRRLFEDQQVVLLILYINKQRKRFSQDNEHFPNIFLNDLYVRSDPTYPLAVASHTHTYWLKYFILKYVCSKPKVSSVELIKYFGDAGYNETLVKVALGSLVTSEFYCINIDNETHVKDRVKWLKPTERGMALVSKNFGLSAMDSQCEFCFSFVHLQLVVEDYLLALPKNIIREMEPIGDYSYIYLKDSSYGPKASAVIRNRAKAAMWFLKVLDASFKCEIEENQEKSKRFENYYPDLKIAKKSLIEEIKSVGVAIDSNEIIVELDSEVASYEDDVFELERFFRDYYKRGVSITI